MFLSNFYFLKPQAHFLTIFDHLLDCPLNSSNLIQKIGNVNADKHTINIDIFVLLHVGRKSHINDKLCAVQSNWQLSKAVATDDHGSIWKRILKSKQIIVLYCFSFSSESLAMIKLHCPSESSPPQTLSSSKHRLFVDAAPTTSTN